LAAPRGYNPPELLGRIVKFQPDIMVMQIGGMTWMNQVLNLSPLAITYPSLQTIYGPVSDSQDSGVSTYP
jgi:hypothetical protein